MYKHQLFLKKDQKKTIKGLDYLAKKISRPTGNENFYFAQDSNYPHVNNTDIWGILLGAYRRVLGFKKDHYAYRGQCLLINDYAEIYWNLLQVIN